MEMSANEAVLTHADAIRRIARAWQRRCHDGIVDVSDLVNVGSLAVLSMWHLRPKYAKLGRSVQHSVGTLAYKGIADFCEDSGTVRVPRAKVLEHLANVRQGAETDPNVARARAVQGFESARESVSSETTTRHDPSDDAGVRRICASARSHNPGRIVAARETWARLIAALTAQEACIVTMHAEGSPLSEVARNLDLPRATCQAALLKARDILKA